MCGSINAPVIRTIFSIRRKFQITDSIRYCRIFLVNSNTEMLGNEHHCTARLSIQELVLLFLPYRQSTGEKVEEIYPDIEERISKVKGLMSDLFIHKKKKTTLSSTRRRKPSIGDDS